MIHLFNKEISSSAKVSTFANVAKSNIGESCFVERRSHISKSRLGPMCTIGKCVKIKECELAGMNSIGANVKLRKVSLGVHTYVASNTSLEHISIGKFCSIGPGVKNHLGNHPSRVFVSSHPAFYSPNSPTGAFVEHGHFDEFGKNVEIGNDVWIGAESLLMDGVAIGNGAIVAARSVVTKHVPPYAIVGGIPAKLIRYRFDEEEIELLEESRWWNRDLSWIKKHISLFHDVKKFTQAIREENT